jgi:quinohemoprotein ethanol dehydrogenase
MTWSKKAIFALAFKATFALVLVSGLAACSADDAASRTSHALLLDSNDGEDWPGFGRTYGEQHFSPLDEINQRTVGQLGLVAFTDLGPGHSVTGPIEVGGVLYFANRHNVVHAVEAKTGKELWVHDTQAAERAGKRMRVVWGTRGVAWRNGKVYTGTTDGRLIALDARSGKEIWSVLTVEKDDIRFITGAPRIFGDKVIVGHGGADSGATRGYVTAYDAETGKQLWRFFVVPGQPGVDNDETTRMAARTWAGEWWKMGGGGTVWNAITYDPETDTVFLGTGNGYPWNHRIRSKGQGDNLFLCSIVALDGKTGTYKWHYQINPGETWDYNASMDLELADVSIDGKLRKVLMTAPKNGFFYVIDRTSGKLISAKPFVDKVTWATGIDLNSGRPIENPAARFPNGGSFDLWPSFVGGHSWLPMAYSPLTRLVYIPTIEVGATYSDANIDLKNWSPPTSNILDVGLLTDFTPLNGPGQERRSYLQAYDPVRQQRVWQVPTPGPIGGGVAVTAGNLVFQGGLDSKFKAHDAATGKLVWSFDVGSPVLAPPIVYRVDGRQYVSVITGMGSSFGTYSSILAYRADYRTQSHFLLTFAIGGKVQLPKPIQAEFRSIEDPGFKVNTSSADRGAAIYWTYCYTCHGSNAVAAGTAPDLRGSAMLLDQASMRQVVKEGVLVPNGMPRFEEIPDEGIADLRQFLRQEAATWRSAKH